MKKLIFEYDLSSLKAILPIDHGLEFRFNNYPHEDLSVETTEWGTIKEFLEWYEGNAVGTDTTRSLWCVYFENTSQPEESGFSIYVVADSRADAKDIAMAKALKTHKYDEIKITNSVRVESEEELK